ncbi:hypothetical protein Poli38472_002345 [Pythium oligandrum]|uniref:Peptidase C1A papain C-terminal domain-containing protein n=1 Tax=Pythium oligandrum TaxID=41045 RepID=A0A8K1FJR2_PYTOL|nr:hypothetical protein Poli38472_002345 [Pythium oligandrum]|eukprot:TMW63404.1 hypothetical protein Poli38472_002345 [Pythium oligandrum]
MTATFTYCWYSDALVGSKGWLEPEMQWASENKGCDGGMTHAAFADAAQLQLSLLSDLSLPYAETKTEATLLPGISSPSTSVPRSESERNKSCARRTDDAVATITGWKQAVGKDCSISSDPTHLLKIALQKQPMSVAITARGTFKEYKGGIYECPDNGDISDSSWLNHAVVLVGYGSEGAVDYWILKNSFGSSWGEKGFMRLRADKKLNCGLNIFPVVPTGAEPGNAKLTIEGGGPVRMLGLSPTTWVTIAVLTALITGGLTAFGIAVSRRRRHTMLQEAVLQ